MKLALAADHTGVEQLKELQSYLESLGHNCTNLGPKTLTPDDDYPDFVVPAARAVASGDCQKAIVLGGDGQGEAMSANRIQGVRCAVFYGPAVPKGVVDAEGRISHDPYEIIRLTRAHNDANVLSLGARFLSLEQMKQVIKLWLDTPFSDAPRHVRRIAKLDQEQK